MVAAGKGGWGGGMGEVVTSRAFFLSFFLSFFPFSFLNTRTAYPENHGLTLNAPNDVFPCRLGGLFINVAYARNLSYDFRKPYERDRTLFTKAFARTNLVVNIRTHITCRTIYEKFVCSQ